SNLSTEISAGDNITYAAGKNLVVKMDDKNTTTPVVTYGLDKDIQVDSVIVGGDTYTDENGNVYNVTKDKDGNYTYTDKDGNTQTVDAANVKGPINIAGNTITGLDSTVSNTTNAPSAVAPTDADETKVATLGDVLNSGWNLQENGDAKDFVKAYDTVNFVNGTGTTAVASPNDDGTLVNVTFNVNVDETTITTKKVEVPVLDKNGKPVVDKEGNPVTTTTTQIAANTGNLVNAGPNVYSDANGNALVKVGDVYYAAADVTNGVPNKDAVAYTGDVTTATGTGKVGAGSSPDALTTAQDVADAINSAYHTINVSSTSKEITQGGEAQQINAGDTVNYVAGQNLVSNITVEADGVTNVTYALAKDISVNSTNVNGTTITSTPVTVKDDKGNDVTTQTLNFADGNGNAVVLNGVADGDISPTSTQAINGSQLYNATAPINALVLSDTLGLPEGKIVIDGLNPNATEEEKAAANGKLATVGTVANAINSAYHTVTVKNSDTQVEEHDGSTKISAGDNITYVAGKNLVVNIADNDTNPTVTYGLAENIQVNSATVGTTKLSSDKEGNLVVGNSNTGAPVQIKNVAAGTADTDAVNVSQLKGVNNRINRVNKDMRAGVAGSNAAASLPQVYIPGKSMVAASAGTFKGEGALAVGYSRASDSGKVLLKLQGNANSRGDVGAGVGIGYQW
ncbi:YadA family autotransporter adhesin, partial [Lonepinella sp. BR2474]|uniref:YadA family autotransporter adhesin n=1 Tax=Lonepinella sp. BR2474 TaxID=3434548 RepID=UPI003F6E0232